MVCEENDLLYKFTSFCEKVGLCIWAERWELGDSIQHSFPCVLNCNIREINTVHNSFWEMIRGLDSTYSTFLEAEFKSPEVDKTGEMRREYKQGSTWFYKMISKRENAVLCLQIEAKDHLCMAASSVS